MRIIFIGKTNDCGSWKSKKKKKKKKPKKNMAKKTWRYFDVSSFGFGFCS